jgi:hypothetical protein
MDRSTPSYAPSTLITVLFPVTVAVGLQPNQLFGDALVPPFSFWRRRAE